MIKAYNGLHVFGQLNVSTMASLKLGSLLIGEPLLWAQCLDTEIYHPPPSPQSVSQWICSNLNDHFGNPQNPPYFQHTSVFFPSEKGFFLTLSVVFLSKDSQNSNNTSDKKKTHFFS